jgi:hypothetical protein
VWSWGILRIRFEEMANQGGSKEGVLVGTQGRKIYQHNKRQAKHN